MDISIVTIARNTAPRLRLALASYEAALADAAALGIRTEVVVVDDGSTDDMAALLAEPSLLHGLRVLRNSPGLGIAGARNRGAAAATGDILLFMDGDVLMSPSFIAAHVRRHREHPRPALVRGPTAHLRCTRALLDPDAGTPFPGQEAAVARMGDALRDHRVTIDDVRHRFETIVARARPGIYVGAVNGELHAAEIEALQHGVGRDVAWMCVPGHNLSLPRATFAAGAGYGEQFIPVEHRELGLRLCTRGLDVLLAPAAVSYHLTHQGRGRDPLNGRQDWVARFYAHHATPAAKLMLVFWHTLAHSKLVPPQGGVGSILEIERILRAGEADRYEPQFRTIVAAAGAAPGG